MDKIVDNSKLLIFDLGNVILNIDMQATIDAFKSLGIEGVERHVTQSHSVGGIFTLFEQGLISPQEFCDYLRQLSNSQITNAQIRDAWNAMIGDISTETIGIIEDLKASHTVVLLSNTNQMHFDYFDHRVQGYRSLSELFDKTWYSHEMHLSKPNKAIYEQVLNYHNIVPEQVAFFDDSDINIEVARQLGINGFIVKGGANRLVQMLKN